MKSLFASTGAFVAFAAAAFAQNTFPASGNVGVGTTTPAAALEVTSTPTSYPRAIQFSSDIGGGTYITANSSGTSRTGTPIYNQSLTLATNGSAFGVNPIIFAEGANGTYVERMRIIYGYVGIGTTSPSDRLEVNNGGIVVGNAVNNFRVQVSRTGANPAVLSIGAFTDSPAIEYSGAGGLRFLSNPSGTDVMHLQPNGNVGIGTATPVGTLNVVTSSGPSFDDGPNALKLGYAGGNNAGAIGAGLVFSQRYDSSDLSQIRVGGIYGYKQTPSSGFGGGLVFYTQPAGAAAFAERMRITCNGYVSIGSTAPDAPLTVKGRIHATEVVVDTAVAAADLKIRPQAWADDVFDESHTLAPLSQVERQIKQDKHLPGIPSATEVAANGISVGDMQARLLAKIEELTLRQIAQEKRIDALEKENASLKAGSVR